MEQDGQANLKRQRDEFADLERFDSELCEGLLAFGGAEMVVKGVEASPRVRCLGDTGSMARLIVFTPFVTKWGNTKTALGDCVT